VEKMVFTIRATCVNLKFGVAIAQIWTAPGNLGLNWPPVPCENLRGLLPEQTPMPMKYMESLVGLLTCPKTHQNTNICVSAICATGVVVTLSRLLKYKCGEFINY